MMTDLLLLVHRIPFPPNKGDKIRAYYLLKQLSKQYRVHLGCFIDDAEDVQYLPKTESICASVKVAYLNPLASRLKSGIGLFSNNALSVPYYFNRSMADWVHKTLRDHNIETVVAYSSPMAQYVLGREFRECKRIMDFVDVDSDKWQQYSQRTIWPMKWVYAREARLLSEFERRISNEFDAVVFASQNEVTLFDRISPETRRKHYAVSNGVAVDYFNPAQEFSVPFDADALPLVFTGMMDYWPNVDAVCWFAQKIFPEIRKVQEHAQFWIVGAAPSREVLSLKSISSVYVTGRVPDVRPYLKHAALAVAPLRVARGIQNKVLEAMAMDCPVLCTPQAAAGLKSDATAPIVLAMSEQEFLDAATDLLTATATNNLPAGAREYVVKHYNWEHNLDWFTKLKTSSTHKSSLLT